VNNLPLYPLKSVGRGEHLHPTHILGPKSLCGNCQPVVVGVGVGGTFEMAALLAKKALMRDMGQRNPDSRYAALELELLDMINATGIGPQGWGGVNTAMDVRVEYYPTHIAAIPLAVNLDCHLHRHTEIVF